MKKYIQPAIKEELLVGEQMMIGTSDMEGYGGPMANEQTVFDNEDDRPKPNNVWEE